MLLEEVFSSAQDTVPLPANLLRSLEAKAWLSPKWTMKVGVSDAEIHPGGAPRRNQRPAGLLLFQKPPRHPILHLWSLRPSVQVALSYLPPPHLQGPR